MAEKPSDVFRKRLKHYRERRGWSQDDLARRLGELGWEVDRAQMTRIEKGQRGISLDEAITIAWVLGLPPAMLYLPLGEADTVAITPNEIGHVHPDLARKWVIGEEPATHSNQRTRQTQHWFEDMSIWWLHERLNVAQDTVYRLQSVGAEAGDEYAQAVEDLSKVLLEFRRAGMSTPKHPIAIADAMAQALRDEEK